MCSEIRKLNPLGMKTEVATTVMWLVLAVRVLTAAGKLVWCRNYPPFKQRAGGEACTRQQLCQEEVEHTLSYLHCLLDYREKRSSLELA